jgi:hypothetical protein
MARCCCLPMPVSLCFLHDSNVTVGGWGRLCYSRGARSAPVHRMDSLLWQLPCSLTPNQSGNVPAGKPAGRFFADLALFASLLMPLALPPVNAHAQSPAENAIPVTVDNFVRAETDMYFGAVVKKGGFGKFEHNRDLVPIDKQTVIRMNRDTLYSGAVFDLDGGPVTITLPDVGARFMTRACLCSAPGRLR